MSGRRAVDRLEHAGIRPLRVDVGAGRQAQAAGDDGAQVGQDVAEQVARHHHVERLRPAHEVHRRRVHQQFARFHVGIIPLHRLEHLVPQHHAELLGVRLGDRRELLAATLPRPSKAARMIRSQPRRVKTLVWTATSLRRALVEPAADRRVFALRILPINQDVDGAGRLVAQRAGDAVEQVRRPQVDVLVEVPPHRQEQAVQGDVVGHVRAADGAEQHRVVTAEHVPAVGRHDAAGLLVVGAAPGQLVPFRRRAIAAQGGVGHADGLVDHFRPDAVAADHGDAGNCHCTTLSVSLCATMRVVSSRRRIIYY